MGNTKEDGKNDNVAELKDEAKANIDQGDKEQASPGRLEPPFHGFDETGRYFIAKIEVRYGYLAVLGFLAEAAQYFRYAIAQQRKAIEEKAIIKPQKSGRFNLFK